MFDNDCYYFQIIMEERERTDKEIEREKCLSHIRSILRLSHDVRSWTTRLQPNWYGDELICLLQDIVK